MKTCENCKKVFEDDMKFCPYCGVEYHDYKDDVKQALFELNEEVEDKKEEEIPTISRVENQEKNNSERENIILNRILIGLIAALILVVGGIGVFAVSKLFDQPRVPVVESPNNEETPNNPETPENPTTPDNPTDTPIQPNDPVEPPTKPEQPITQNDLVKVVEVDIDRENKNIKIEIKSESNVDVNVYLRNNQGMNIGPIEVKKGKSEFYFLINQVSDVVVYFESTDASASFEYSITAEKINLELKD